MDTVLDNPDPTDGGTVAAHINHGRFWVSSVDLPFSLFWDAYVAPRTPGFLVSDGYGTDHAFLWQTQPSPDGTELVFQGSIFNGTNQPFTAAEGPAPGEWGYHAVSLLIPTTLSQPHVFTYWNGVAVGLSTFGVRMRRTPASTGHGEGNLLVMGGTAGTTLGGRIAALRAWDASVPFGGDSSNWAFIPERTFSAAVGPKPADLLIDYTVGGFQVPDLAPIGYAGGGIGPALAHPGALQNAPEDQLSQRGGPGPHWVSDLESPYGKAGGLPHPGERSRSPLPAPAGALVFDSFARASQTFAFQLFPTLGSTESGSLGPRIWNSRTVALPLMPAAFGILNGRAVFLEREAGLAWIDCGTADQDIRITRFIGPGQLGTTGIAFRVVDPKNWWYAIVAAVPGVVTSRILLGYFLNTTLTDVTSYAVPAAGWETLRVVALGSTLNFYIDNQAGGWTLVGSLSTPVLQNGTGAGLAGARLANEASSLWRGDAFTICPAATGC